MVRGLAWTMSVVYWTNRAMLKDVGVFAPQHDEASKPVMLGTIDGLAIPATSKHPDLAFEFATFLANKENSFRYNEYAGGISPRQDAAVLALESKSYLAPFYPLLQHLALATPYPYWLHDVKAALAGKLTAEQILGQSEEVSQTNLDKWWKDLGLASR
jgi:ABC-type glycerol-3-phosphate transport system substrate-binding protein